ncbi:MAG: hypothetical protein AAGA96_20545 [Verrucomicrobiota bacterium]
MKPSDDLTFLWPQVSTKADDGSITTKTSGYEGDYHWTGERTFTPDDEFHAVWDWVYGNRHAFPPVFDDDLLVAVNAYYESDMSQRYRDSGIHLPSEPIDVFVHAYWSADSVWAEQKLRDTDLLPDNLLKIDPLPRSELWGFLMPFCHGYGEYLTFEDGRCAFYAPLGKERSAFDRYAEMIRKHHEDRTRRG